MLRETNYFKTWYEMAELETSTRKSYGSSLKHFEAYLMETGVSEDEVLDFERLFVDANGKHWPINRNFIRDYVVWLQQRLTEKPTAATNAFQAVKSFFQTLHSIDMISTDPTQGIKGPKYHKSKRNNRLSRDETLALFQAAKRTDPFRKRSLLVVYLMVLCGLRGGEVRALTLDQIDLQNGLIRVDRGQRTGPGVAVIPEVVLAILKHYIGHPYFAQTVRSGGEPLLRDTHGDSLTHVQLAYEVNKLAKAAGIPRSISPHVLRHTYASLANEAGIPLKIIRDMLRHVDEQTTLTYVNPSKEADLHILNESPMARMFKRLGSTGERIQQ
ncbi:tyrosine-type recombinase/integrase [Alicyclobacillus sp. SO9]|uniref:tyrosine-type recombinase/integrase n=1 Tax=Alicyclobacillus sp. SO9 TaxID=2665646 RepID=UPI0018E82F99|nr:tyrosine-type recombinase/integrase [Alicyclobacillus sp. SO9]QQE77305.1 tyrosine-type recombinase/integrase [Alicyclobacillus sp. SO9]